MLRRAFCAALLCSIVFAACSRAGVPSLLPLAQTYSNTQAARTASPIAGPAEALNYKVLHRFMGSPDGGGPNGSLLDANGELYGTTNYGGSVHNGGTVYKVSTAGLEHVLYRFKLLYGPQSPTTGLIDVNGTLYGATSRSVSNNGTVFSVTTAGREHVVHTFNGAVDGSGPQGLTAVKGELYGTMGFGGADGGYGTVFAVSTNGDERVVHTFKEANDGRYPSGHLVYLNGTLYGVTKGGGKHDCGRVRCGAIFAVSTTGTERVVYSFKGPPDGQDPQGVIGVKGVLYGTTEHGGANNFGTVFRVTTSGQERVLYGFKGDTDGAYPYAATLTFINGSLFGTTPNGGIDACGSHAYGCGTVFALSMSGAERVLHRFKGGADEGAPLAGLTYAGGKLYGTTSGDGVGLGTVFTLSP